MYRFVGSGGKLGSATPALPVVPAGVGRSRRWVHRASVAALSGAALAACVPAGGAPPAATAERTVRIVYFHQWPQAAAHWPATERAVAAFQAQAPTIQVEPTFGGPGPVEYYEKLATVLAGGDFPDVVTTNNETVPRMVRSQATVAIESLAKGTQRYDKNDLSPGSREAVTFDDKVWAAPYFADTLGLAYNRSLFEQRGLDPAKPPATWNDFTEAGRRISAGDGDAQIWGFRQQRGTATNPVVHYIAHLRQAGGDAVDMQRRVAIWNSPQGVEALQFWVDLVHKHGASALQQPGDAFETGRAGMVYVYASGSSTQEARIGNQFALGTGELPRGKQPATHFGGHTLHVMKTGKFQDQAWRYVHWFTSPNNLVEYDVAVSGLPPWKSAQQHPAWQRLIREQPRMQPYVDALAYGRPAPKLTRLAEVLKALGDAMESALTLKQPPKAALDEAVRLAEPYIKEG